MPHHTPGISCQAEQLLCFHTTLPWMWLANTEVCGDLRLTLLPFHKHTHTHTHLVMHQWMGQIVKKLAGMVQDG